MKSNISKTIAALWIIPVFMCAVAIFFDAPECAFGVDDLTQGWLPVVMAAISAASAIGSAAMGNQQKRKTRKTLDDRQRKLDAWRDESLAGNYLDRADSQAALRMVKEYNDDALKALNSDAIKSGMTDEAKAATASRMNRSYADAVSRIAGLGEQHRQRVSDLYLQQSGDLSNQQLALNSTSGAQNTFDVIGQVAGTLGSIVGSSTKAPAATAPTVSPRAVDMAASGYLPNNQANADWARNKYKINI